MKKIGVVYILCAGALWGSMGVFVNLLKSFGFTALQCTTLRIIAAAFIFLMYTLIKDKNKFKIQWRDCPLLILIGLISITAMSVLYISAIDKTSLSVAAVLLYTSPIFVMVMSVLFLKEKFTILKAAAVVCAFAGCYFIAGTKDAAVSPIGIVVGLCAGFAYATYSIFGTFALKKHHTLTITTYAFGFGALAMLFLGDVQGIWHTMQQSEQIWQPIGAALITGLVTAVAPFLFYTAGLKKVPADKAAVIACAEPLVASLLGLVLYQEELHYFGIFLIILAIFISQYKTAGCK